MPDIRSFFGPKGGAAAPKPAPKPTSTETKRAPKGRKVIEDSDDEKVVEVKKPVSKPVLKRKAADAELKGTSISADDYFASSKGKTSQPTKSGDSSPHLKKEVSIRVNPRDKQRLPAPAKNDTTKKRGTTSYKKHAIHDDEDAYMEDAEEDADDVFAADIKGPGKRMNDDYHEDDDDDNEEVLPQIKRRDRPSAVEKALNDYKKPSRAVSSAKKRKSPEPDSDEEEEQAPRKKTATTKPRAPRAKKADEPEDTDIQNILDSVTTVRAPTPPPKDLNAKFDWKKSAAGGGGNASAQPSEVADIPKGEDECLSGLTFVFTGILSTISRDEGQTLVKRYGGKVTGQPSSKTSFVVLGADAGPSKLSKIHSLGIKTIDENGLFDLIRKLPAYGGSGKGAQKAQEKKKAEHDKILKQIAEIKTEEKAMRAKEAEKAAANQDTMGRPAPPPVSPAAQLLTAKYAPTKINQICGNKGQVEKIQKWLANWAKSKKYNFQRRGADGMGAERAIILSGPPGIGKTTAAHLAANLAGYDVLESNASDTRSKKLVESGVSDVMNNTSLLGYFAGYGKDVEAGKKNIVLIMDEVDGMSAGDRGGVGALAKFCKKTEIPLILICNERKLPKMKPFDHAAFDVKFNRPTVEQVRGRIMTICCREGLKLPVSVVDALIEGSNKDIRQIINMISTAKLDQKNMDFDQGKAMTKAWEKHVVLKPWDICQKMLAGGLFAPTSKATLNDKIELYFNDHEFSYLMIQENYIRTKPMALSNRGYSKREEKLKALELFDQAAESISDGDLVDRMIHGPQQQWSLMPTHAVFSTVRPASFISGMLLGSNFTSWLGNNSKIGRLSRFNREMHSHMRLKTSGDHNEIRQEYMPVLWNGLVNRLQCEGPDAVPEVIELMDSYYLTREDLDAIQELGVGHMTEEKVKIDSKAKAAFTRKYNTMSHPVPFMKASNIIAPKAQPKEAPDLEEAIEDDLAEVADAPEPEDEDEIDFKKDKYIKQPKAKKPAAKKATKKAAKGDDDEDEDKPKKATKAKSAPKGRAR